MTETKKKIKDELTNLVQTGRFIHYNELFTQKKLGKAEIDHLDKWKEFQEFRKKFTTLGLAYNNWYSKSTRVIEQLLPDRISEFKKLYTEDKRATKDISFINYNISDYLIGLSIKRGETTIVDSLGAFHAKIEQQISILNSCLEIIDSRLSDIEGVLQSELFSNELEMADDMLKKKYNRAAGALAGVTLEVHLSKVCKNHKLSFKKAHPTISDFNEELRKNEFIDIPTWRLIQRLGDIRNMSVHSKEREPTNDEVQDLIRGCQKLIAELF